MVRETISRGYIPLPRLCAGYFLQGIPAVFSLTVLLTLLILLVFLAAAALFSYPV